MTDLTKLPDRAVVHLSGSETVDFLQRIVTNDIARADANNGVYTALLTPQGKYLFDFFMVGDGTGGYFLDCPAALKDEFIKRLTMYKLRADVTIDDRADRQAVFWADNPAAAPADATAFADPRVAGLGTRIIASADTPPADTGGAAYQARRFALGVPDLPVDAERERTLSLEADLDLLNGVDFTKGCFVGQELTARMKYRGKVRKRLMPLKVDGAVPAADTPVLTDAGKEAGKIRSGGAGVAIALMRLDALDKGPLTAGGVPVAPWQPDWMQEADAAAE